MNRDWLKKCFYTAEKLYCVYPYEVLEQLYGVGEKGGLNKDEVIAFVEESDPIITEYVDATYPTFEDLGYQEPGFFRPVLMDNYDDEDEKYNYIHAAYGIGRPVPVIGFSELDVEELLKEQGARPFYIPSKDEINRIVETGLNGNKYYDRLKKMIRKGLNASEYISSIWQHFSVGVDYNDELNFIFPNLEIETSIVDGKKVLDISIEELNEINSHIAECYNHTNRMGSRGWEPIKLMAFLNGGNPRPSKPDIIIPLSEAAAKQAKEAEGYLNSMGVNVDYDAGFGKYNTIVDGKIKRVKVGRNDPCPCGSGKKYKNCHGRGEK